MKRLPRFLLDSMLMTFLLALLALPITSLGLLNPQVVTPKSQVLSSQDERTLPEPTPPPSMEEGDGINTTAPLPIEEFIQALESSESTFSTN